MIYVAIFVLIGLIAVYLMFGSEKEEKVKEEGTKKEIVVEKKYTPEVEEAKKFLGEYVYKEKEIKLVQSNKNYNAFYFEDLGYAITILENKKNKTVQVMKLKPYKMVASVVMQPNSTLNTQVNVQKEYEDLKYMFKIFFERLNRIPLKTINKEKRDVDIVAAKERIEELIRRFDEYGEKTRRTEEIKNIDLPYILKKYNHLDTYELREGKEKMLSEMKKIEDELDIQWQAYVEEKRRAYEKVKDVN